MLHRIGVEVLRFFPGSHSKEDGSWKLLNALRFDRFLHQVTLICFCVLFFILPIAHTETVRAFALGIPGGIWIFRMVGYRQWPSSRPFIDLPILLFTAISIVSIFTAVDWRYSLDEFQGEWIMGVFALYLAMNTIRVEWVKPLLGALLLSNLVMVGFGIFGFFAAGGSLWDYQVRAGSLHSGYGTFSTYLVTMLPYLLWGFYAQRERKGYGWLLGILIGLNLFALFLTHARGAWFSAIALFTITGWMRMKRRVFLLPIGIGLLLLFFWVPESLIKHYTPIKSKSIPETKIETGHTRWELIKFSLKEIKENPFQMIGFGQGSFVKKYREFSLKYDGAQLWHAHNTFLNIALQTGIQGLIIFCFLIYRLLKYFYTGYKRSEGQLEKFYLGATFLMITTFFIRNLSDDFFVDDSALLFWLLVGMGFVLKQDDMAKNIH